MIQWARLNTPQVGAAETDAFIDFWRGKPGNAGTKLDWLGTWRNWMRREQKRIDERRGGLRSVPTGPVKDIPDAQIDPDLILGKDYWQPPAPPPEVDDGPVVERRAWCDARRAERKAERIAEARAALARKQNRSAQ
jgi:hypothetical protein